MLLAENYISDASLPAIVFRIEEIYFYKLRPYILANHFSPSRVVQVPRRCLIHVFLKYSNLLPNFFSCTYLITYKLIIKNIIKLVLSLFSRLLLLGIFKCDNACIRGESLMMVCSDLQVMLISLHLHLAPKTESPPHLL